MAKYKAPTIAELGGLKKHLGDDLYHRFTDLHLAQVNPTNIARALGKNRATINRWIAEYEREQKHGKK